MYICGNTVGGVLSLHRKIIKNVCAIIMNGAGEPGGGQACICGGKESPQNSQGMKVVLKGQF